MTERTLFLNGTIAEESWFDDDVTPQLFKDELNAGSGDITVWINSPGGDCVAAAQIYNMLMDYKGNVTVKIDGIAASAASVIAMAGTKDSIINAYEIKTGLSRTRLSHLMDAETWMDANKAVELGFADEVMKRGEADAEDHDPPEVSMMYSEAKVVNSLMDKIAERCRIEHKPTEDSTKVKADSLMDRLNLLKNWR